MDSRGGIEGTANGHPEWCRRRGVVEFAQVSCVDEVVGDAHGADRVHAGVEKSGRRSGRRSRPRLGDVAVLRGAVVVWRGEFAVGVALADRPDTWVALGAVGYAYRMARVDSRDELLHGLASRIAARVVDAVSSVARDVFVPAELREHAWSDRPLPIGAGQTISQPSLVAKMCELLELEGDERVLDVGTGSGYHAAVLSRLCEHVVSIERQRWLSAQAQRNLAAAGIGNVTLVVGDGTKGHPEQAPYDAINVAAASSGGVPPALTQQLTPMGRLVVPVDGKSQQLMLVQRRDGEFERTAVTPVRFVPLVSNDEEQQLAETIIDLVE